MMTVDVRNPVEVRGVCIRLLNEGVGVDVTKAFMKQCFGGSGDLTKEKYDEPDMTPEEFTNMMEIIKTDAIKQETW